MKDLAARGSGIVLLHDIHPSTAKALPALLAKLQERGYKVVHLMARGTAETLADYDEAVRKEIERRRLAASGHTLAKRAVTWPLGDSAEAVARSKHSPRPDVQPPPPGVDGDWTSSIWRQ
jgi:hypothetical protein